MKYLDSAMNSSMSSTYLTHDKIMFTLWFGVIVYDVFLFILWIWLTVSYPGYINNGTTDEYNYWIKTTFHKILTTATAL